MKISQTRTARFLSSWPDDPCYEECNERAVSSDCFTSSFLFQGRHVVSHLFLLQYMRKLWKL